ncbi:MAG: DUF1028 domain-containing protein [Reyranellaceae bacterium]|uniref:DUF1028 domain-containing protein n=1 Tax=Reyranella sp. TaxID=1929291 RepID=UPI003784D8A1
MTFTIVARCPRSGQVGIGIATYSICVGLYCNGLRGNVGATMTQAFVNQGNNTLALRLLAEGFTPAHVLAELAANDPDFAYRQIAVVDREGRAVAHSGPKTRGYAGHAVGEGYVAMGNVLAGHHVVEAIAKGYEAAADESFERRLLRAIEAGRDAGGQVGNDGHLTERSAAVLVHGAYDHAELDLRVDLHDHAVDELRRAFEEYELYRGYYRDRGKNPRGAIPQDAFVAQLADKGAAR